MGEDWTGRVFTADLAAFRRDFASRSFMLRHNLAQHPLFTLDRLALAAERAVAAGKGGRFVAAGDAGKLDSRFEMMGGRVSSPDLIVKLSSARSWSKLSGIDAFDADYADLLSDALADLRDMLDEPRLTPSRAHFTVFMTSPNIVTPFHMDHEANILSQVAGGEKTFCAFSPDDRDLVSLAQVERFYVKDINAATYDPALQGRGAEHALRPGTAICVPPLAPHWVKNGNDTSISLSLSLCFAHLERRARVHQVNYHLRRIGFDPGEPGASLIDRAKAKFLDLLSKRNPASSRELVFSGVERLRYPGRLARRILRALGIGRRDDA